MEECSSCSGSEYEVEESGCVLGFGELGRDGEMHLEHSVVQQEEEEVRLDGVAKRQSLWSEYMECIMEELLNRIVDLRKPIYSRELEKNRQEKQIKEEQMRRQSLALREQLLRSKSKKKTKTAHSSDKRISDTSGKIALVIKKPEVGIPPKLAVKLNPIPRQSSKSTTSKRSRSRRNSRDMWSSTWNSDSSSSDEDLNMFDDLSIGSEDEEDEDLEEELRLIEQKKNSNSSGSQTVLKIKLGDNRDQLSLTTSAMSQVDYMNELIVKFMRLDKFQIFIDPVDPAVVPMYYEVIKDPMDFSKIKENIGNGKYQSLSQFQADVNLVFQNCICFNGKDTLYHRQALLLKNQCGRLIREAMEKYGCVELNPFVLDYIPIEDFCYPVDEEDVRRKMSTSIAGDCSSVENQCCTDLAKLGPFNISTGKFISSCKDRFLSRECGPKCACDPKLCQNRLDSIKEVSAWLGKRLSFGIDQYTYRQLFKALPSYSKSGEHLPKAIRDEFLEEIMINALNEFVPQSWNEIRQNVHMEYSMSKLVERISFIGPMSKQEELSLLFARSILSAIRSRRERFPVYSKGYGIVNKSECTIRKNSIIAEYIGEVYPAWRFSEKQCVMRQMQRKYSSTHTIGFYNIVMERHL